MAKNFPNLMKNVNLHIQKLNECEWDKQFHIETHYNQIWKPKSERETWKHQEETIHHTQGNSNKFNGWFLIKKTWSPESNGMTYWKYWEKNIVTQNSSLAKWRRKLRYFYINKSSEILLLVDLALQEMLKGIFQTEEIRQELESTWRNSTIKWLYMHI